MSWGDRRVLVTGAGGFVGSWLAQALVERGAQVTCLLYDRDKSITSLDVHGLRDRVDVEWADVADYDALERVVGLGGFDTCFHLAAQAIVGIANRSPLSTFETNVRGTWNLLEACRVVGGLERIVVASSDKAYGEHETLPYTEELQLAGAFPYDASKACLDIVSRSYARTYQMPVAVTRMANIYGGGDLNLSRIVPGTILAALAGEDPVIRSDGTPVRDYLYVEDAVEGYLLLAERLEDERVRGEAFNFGTSSPVAVLELVELIVEAVGADVRPNVLGTARLHGEIDRQYLASEKAERLLGWRARTPLREGLARTIAWYREHAPVAR